MYSQKELVKRFMLGRTTGTASNMSIIDMDEITVLCGFGHAAYATRRKSDGRITAFAGWYFGGTRDYAGSNATKTQWGRCDIKDVADCLVTPAVAQTPAEREYVAESDAHSSDTTFTAPKVSTARMATRDAADFPL